MEEWKDIKGYEGYYQVSNLGQVRSLERKQRCCGGGYSTKKEKILKPHLNQGYGRVSLCVDRETKHLFTHRLVADAFIPNPENKLQINHKNGKPTDNRVENLEWVTSKENIRHAVKIGLIKRGGLSRLAKIKDSDVAEIRRLRDSSNHMPIMSRTEVAKRYGVCKDLVTQVCYKLGRFRYI